MTNAYESFPGGSERESSQTGGRVKEKARQAARSAKDTAGRALHEARERAGSALDQQIEAASSRLDHFADAIEHTATELDDDPMIANLAHRAADGVHQLSGYLREHDLRDLVDQVEDFARRHPVWFLGGMFVAGMLAARLLKSGSADDGEYGQDGYLYGQEREHGVGYEGDYETSASTAGMAGPSRDQPRLGAQSRWEAP